MAIIFDTSSLKIEDQFSYWREFVCDTFLGLKAERSERAPFEARMECHAIGNVSVALARFAAQRMYRGAPEIAQTTEDAYCLHLIRKGVTHVSSHEVTAHAGDLVLLDTSIPFNAVIRTPSLETTIIHLPKRLIEARLSPSTDVHTRLRGDEGAGALLAGYVKSLGQAIGTLPLEMSNKAGEIFCDLLAATIAPAGKASEAIRGGIRAARLAAAKQYISRHLTNPFLDAAKIARNLGVSERYVHKLFEPTGRSLGESLVIARLDACRHALRMPTENYRTIADIAYEFGFNDLSGFYRRYRARWGETPGDTRSGFTHNP
ncbi:helix-turn-helix domain-containing protein [Microvirga terricola]|uniref:Helix-turn-helix domain-containing protein n=1 Tax=Microvirga terricola TaxID=2719797 RepID=A0ABX0VBY3_9HYPH|nr:helix-turn-helix domain-containing protein [Microvirga terricola]NIX75886.1 helix-turn-helix domain-containing protein [Microvirga terricola]